MRAEILMIGTELLLGQIQDTNATYLAQTLAANGVFLYQKTTVGDNRERIVGALENALKRSDVVLCSGGLGPTEDDITRECIAEVLGRTMSYREELFESIVVRFSQYRLQITENNKKQATLPDGAVAIENPYGTAPGVLVEDPRGIIICMPGVPSELKPMLEDRVLPYLREKFSLDGLLHYRTLKVVGIGESRVDAMMGDLINSEQNPTVGLLASPEAVRIRITAHAPNRDEAERMIDATAAKVHERMPGLIYGQDEDTIEGVIDALLIELGWKIAVLEGSTGGKLCQRLCAAKAKSFAGGKVVTGVVVSSEDEGIDTLRGFLLGYASECGLALLPMEGEQGSVVVFITPEAQVCWNLPFSGTGERFQLRAALVALEYVRRYLTGSEV
jgi:nicotinamide-nucleotide amidase